jgi:hypothetical protein
LESKEKVEKYKKRSLHYFENAGYFIDIGEVEKASEFLWGGMTQALKAVAAVKSAQLRSHNALRNYAYELDRALPGEKIWYSFNLAQSLHGNFYESEKTIEDVIVAAEEIKKTAARLIGLVPED